MPAGLQPCPQGHCEGSLLSLPGGCEKGGWWSVGGGVGGPLREGIGAEGQVGGSPRQTTSTSQTGRRSKQRLSNWRLTASPQALDPCYPR